MGAVNRAPPTTFVWGGVACIVLDMARFIKPPLTNLVKSIPKEVQDRVFTDQELSLIAHHVVNWRHKALGLGLSDGEIDTIKGDSHSTQMQKCDMMRRWARKCDDKANLRELIRLTRLNHWESSFIQNVCKEFGYGKQKGTA